jgi:uncharacterized membrane protein YfcA
VVWKIGIPGAVGAFAGATFLSSLSTETAAPLMALILLALGTYVLLRFTLKGLPKANLRDKRLWLDGGCRPRVPALLPALRRR